MFVQAGRRLAFLRNKIIADLTESKKIFVYKITMRSLSDDELLTLDNALRRYGAPTLLYVREEDVDHPNGTVVSVNANVLVGYIDHFASTRPDRRLSAATKSWGAICRNVYRTFNERQS